MASSQITRANFPWLLLGLGGLLACSSDLGAGSIAFAPYFVLRTGSWPEAVAIGDLNGDGRNDVVMTTSYFAHPSDASILIFYQNDAGLLDPPVQYPAGGAALSVVIGDFNGDGRNDIAVGANGIRIFFQDAQGRFGAFTDYPSLNSARICAGDFDHDGRVDLAGIHADTDLVDVFTQTTNGLMAFAAEYSAGGSGSNDVHAGDVNGDGLTDIVVSSSLRTNITVLLQTNGGFSSPIVYSLGNDPPPSGLGLGDVTGDGRNDVVLGHGELEPSSKLTVFQQTAAGVLARGQTCDSLGYPESLAVGDMNSDGRGDVVALHGGGAAVGVYLQNTNGSLDPEQLFPIPRTPHYNPRALAIGDINGDGKPDIVLAASSDGLIVLYNQSPLPPGAPSVKGFYQGLFYDPTNTAVVSSGFFKATVTDRSAFSGRVSFAGRGYGFSGKFDAFSAATLVVKRAGLSPLTVHLVLDNPSDKLRGFVTDGSWRANLVADRLVFGASTRPAPMAGSYTLVMPAPESSGNGPPGTSFGTAKGAASGRISLSLALAEGTRVAQSSAVSKAGAWPLFSGLYRGTGMVLGWMQFTNQVDSDFSGATIWVKPADPHGKYYPAGFTNALLISGEKYGALRGQKVLNMTGGALVLSSGGLASPITNFVRLELNNKVTNLSSNKLRLQIRSASGLFGGTAQNPEGGKALVFQGVLLQKSNAGRGFFLNAGQSGAVELNPAR